MQLSEQGIALIKRSEGFSAEIYLCPAGKPTVGYGHVIGKGERFPRPISREEAEAILIKDIERTEQAVRRLVTAGVTQGQFDALVSLAYNIGIGAFGTSTLLRLLNAGDATGAAREFGRWVYSGGRRLEGLTRRRAAEAALFSRNT